MGRGQALVVSPQDCGFTYPDGSLQISHLDPEVESFVLVSELKFLGRVGF